MEDLATFVEKVTNLNFH